MVWQKTPMGEKDMQIEHIKIPHHNREVDGTFYKPDGKESFPVVIFSHGYNGHKTDFEISARYFATNGIGAVCYTFCGGSTRDSSGFPTTEMTLFTEKEDLLALIDEVKTWECVDKENIYLFGASQGGMVSALTAEERQEDIPERKDVWGMLLGDKFFKAVRGFHVKEQIGSFSKNVLIMHGTEDSVVLIDYADWASKHYPNARLEVFQEEGHGFSEEGNRRMEAMALYFVHECLEQNK